MKTLRQLVLEEEIKMLFSNDGCPVSLLEVGAGSRDSSAHNQSRSQASSWAAPRTTANLLLIQCIMIIMSGPKDASVPWHRGAIVAAMNGALDGPDQLIGTEWGSGMEQGTAEPEPRLRLKTCTWRTRPACRYESAGGIRATGKEEGELVEEEREETYYNTQEDTLSINLIDTISECYFWNFLLQSGSFMMLVTPSRESGARENLPALQQE